MQGGGEESLRPFLSLGVAGSGEDPLDAHRVLPGSVPKRGAGDVFECDRVSIVPWDLCGEPLGGRVPGSLGKGGLACSLLGFSTSFAGNRSGGRIKEGAVEPEAGDEEDGRGKSVAGMGQGNGRVGSVSNQDDRSANYPAAHLPDHLAGPIDGGFVSLADALVVGLGVGEDGEEGQSPASFAPGQGNYEHHGDPLKAEAAHDMLFRGPDGIAADPLGLDLPPLPALNGFIDSHDEGSTCGSEQDKEAQEDPGCLKTVPAGTVEYPMVVGEAWVVIEPHDAQTGGDGPVSVAAKNGPDDEDEGVAPNGGGEKKAEMDQNRMGFTGQCKHGSPPVDGV